MLEITVSSAPAASDPRTPPRDLPRKSRTRNAGEYHVSSAYRHVIDVLNQSPSLQNGGEISEHDHTNGRRFHGGGTSHDPVLLRGGHRPRRPTDSNVRARPAADKRGFRRFLSELGPGLITGAADDDPSGISTYSMAVATFGYVPLWTALFSFPLMAAVQLMCARLGLVTGLGLAGVIRRRYSRSRRPRAPWRRPAALVQMRRAVQRVTAHFRPRIPGGQRARAATGRPPRHLRTSPSGPSGWTSGGGGGSRPS